MKNKNIVYVATMYRWGDRELHSYVLGIFTTKTKAERATTKEIDNRGGKYFPEVLEIPLDGEYKHFKPIIELKDINKITNTKYLPHQRPTP